MIIIVETIDIKKTKNILPRQSVLDKIRVDFAAKNADRCVSILNPLKFENKSTESFRSMIQRMRHLILSGYNKNIIKFEEIIRSRREERNKEDWDFCSYFLLQEQLAFVLEMLTLHSDALVQYDELDAMFNLFVINTVFGEKPKWMKTFEKPLNNFRGISMCKKDIDSVRKKIMNQTVTLIEFRNYLFQRQCQLLNSMNNQWEIAQRLFPFLFSTMRETEAIRLEAYQGSLACWQFVNCLEVLNLCDCVVGTENIIKCSQNTASIWNHAKDKLFELGKLCGLLPGTSPTSEQLHIVVQLSSAIGDNPERDAEELKELEIKRSHSPSRRIPKAGCEKLREALGSNDNFTKLYLELSELAISTYKHVSRLRFARLVGLDLGNFYCALDEPQKAIVFFTDLLRELKNEKWSPLSSQTLLELANCYKKMNDSLSYTKVCASISCCVDLETLVRTFYFDEFLKSLKNIQSLLNVSETSSNNYVSLEDHFAVVDAHLFNKSPIIQDSVLDFELKIESHFPREILCEMIAVSFELVGKTNKQENCQHSNEFDMLPFSIHLDYKQDSSLSGASVVCESNKEKVRRTSSGKSDNSPVTRYDFTNAAVVKNILIHPGFNIFTLTTKACQVGTFNFKQISIQFQNLDFLSKCIPVKVENFEVSTKPSSASLHFANLVAGIDQPLKLMISGGSFHFPKEASITLKGSKGLRLKIEDSAEYQRTVVVTLLDFKLFEERTIELKAICELPCRRDESLIEQKVTLQSPWSESEIQIPLKFLPLMTACCRLHSSGSKKFLQVITKSLYDKELVLFDAVMKCKMEGIIITDLNPKSQSKLTITKNISVSYLYEIEIELLKTHNELPVISIEFNLMYNEAEKPDDIRRFICPFDVTDYKTLYEVKVKIEPSELCRVGSICHLNLTIIKLCDSVTHKDLMYEVLFDQNLWAVYGRSAGVINIGDVNESNITLDVFPLTPGFLPLPNVRISKYISNNKSKNDSKLVPFAPTQVYNSTKSLQIHVLASNNVDQQNQ